MKEPEGLARLRTAGGRHPGRRPLDPLLGEWARALAAAKPGSALLHLCESSDEMALWIHSGMDLGSRLVVVTPDRHGTSALDDALGFDLRVTCHHQSPDEFLDDIRSHRFGLIVNDAAPGNPDRIRRIWEVLAPGGMLLLCALDAGSAAPAPGALSAVDWLRDRDDAAVARNPGLGNAVFAVRLVPAPPATRRGGSRARREPGSVTALRPRT